jgi:hypothetical protein
MQATNQKRPYSPQFSYQATVSVRRLSWAMGVSMPAAVNIMVRLMPLIVNPSKVCPACKDNTKCKSCIFNAPSAQQETGALSQLTPQEQEALETVC